MDRSYSFAYAPRVPDNTFDMALSDDLQVHWQTVCEAAQIIARFGDIPAAFVTEIVDRQPDLGSARTGTLRQLAGWAIADVAAALQTGLRALASMAEAGRDTVQAARTLWMELARAHGELVTLCETGRMRR